MGWTNWGGPGYSEHRVGPVDQGRDLLELLGTDLVAHWLPPVGTAGASSQMLRMSIPLQMGMFSARSTVEILAGELSPACLWATATTTRTTRSQDQ
jgi:membrane protein implicated in regulation of membrane protease activity